MIEDETEKPDVVVYYCHGGGFSMGSSYFYIEFLLGLVAILKESGYRNPALFALEYTLVPEATFPKQIHQAQAGYDFVLTKVDDPAKVCVAGDSAGATLVLSLLLSLAKPPVQRSRLPGFATLISPWTTILSPENRNTSSDYLNATTLHQYGSQYLGHQATDDDPVASPGTCSDLSWWKRASPVHGWFFIYGTEEVFTSEAQKMVRMLRKAGSEVTVHEEPAGIHAWPVVKLFLCDSQSERQSGLRSIVKAIKANMPPESQDLTKV